MDCGSPSDSGASDPADAGTYTYAGYVLSVLLRRSGSGTIRRPRAKNRGCTEGAERALNEQRVTEGPEFKQKAAVLALYDVSHILT